MTQPTKASSWALYKRLAGYLRHDWKVFSVSIIAMVIASATEPLFASLMKPLINEGFVNRNPHELLWTSMSIVGLFVVRALASFGNDYSTTWLASRLVVRLREAMFAKLLRLPVSYYDNNVVGTHRLLMAMQNCDVATLVFSSSATVYGEPQRLPLTEDHPLSATNPYGRSKLIIEDMLRDVYRVKADLRIAILRYFNPVGAHESGLIGENPLGIPSNLMPFVAQVAVGRREYLNVWGNDYATHDGTGVRDYIHVVDLALGHLKALERLDLPQCTEVNLGTGNGYSVLEVVKAFENASGQCVPYRISQRRPGDVAACYADPSHAERYLGWKAERDLAAMCRDHWNWQKQNPQGYV